MSDDGLWNMVRREAAQPANARAPIRVAEVTSYDPDTHSVKVKIQPEGQETGWMPLGSLHVGDGHGLAIGATEGDQVVLGFIEGDHSAPVVMGRIFSDDQKPPKVKSGEIGIFHKSKCSLMFDKDGQITLNHSTGGSLFWDKDGKVNLKAKSLQHDIEQGLTITAAGGGNLA
ncbi:phage baseplate assembly protein V [Methylobacterium sp. D53M]